MSAAVAKPAPVYASVKPPPNPLVTSVLTSDVINEAEQTFQILCNEQKKARGKPDPIDMISILDMVRLIRSMGMNPTDSDINKLVDVMKLRDPEKERQERIERDAWLKKERERKQKEREEREAMKDDKKAQAKAAAGKKKKEEEKETFFYEPPEKRLLITWDMFIRNIEPFYRDNKIEEEEVMKALKVFDRDAKGWINRDDLVRILVTKGEDILAPLEVTAFQELFPNARIDFREFAQKVQGTWVEPIKVEEEASSTTSKRATLNPTSSNLPPGSAGGSTGSGSNTQREGSGSVSGAATPAAGSAAGSGGAAAAAAPPTSGRDASVAGSTTGSQPSSAGKPSS